MQPPFFLFLCLTFGSEYALATAVPSPSPSLVPTLAPTSVPTDPRALVITGVYSNDVAATISGGGTINIENNGAHVAATQQGLGSIIIVNNGGPITATNTGNGTMSIFSDCTAAVTVSKTGNGFTFVNVTGTSAITYTIDGNGDYTYPQVFIYPTMVPSPAPSKIVVPSSLPTSVPSSAPTSSMSPTKKDQRCEPYNIHVGASFELFLCGLFISDICVKIYLYLTSHVSLYHHIKSAQITRTVQVWHLG
jgi:hypothetical protein